MIRRLQYVSVLHEFHHVLDVGGAVLEVKAHIVVKLLHGSHELVFLCCCFSIALDNVPVRFCQHTLESTHPIHGSAWGAVDVASSICSPGRASVCGSSSRGCICASTHVLFGLYFLGSYFFSHKFNFKKLKHDNLRLARVEW